IRPVGMNFRGCSGEPNRTVRFYHSGETGDIRHVLDELHRRFPGRPMGAVGFSLGGNVLLKYLGEVGEDGDGERRVQAAVTVSVPFDLSAGADRLEEGPWGRFYSYYFLRMLRRKIRLKEALVTGHVDVAEALSAPTLRRFDDAATAPIHGFESAQDYYTRSSSAVFLSRIDTPTLLLQSRDDPFLPEAALPEDTMRRNPNLIAGITERGGHVGFVEGSPWAPSFWSEAEAARFLAHLLETA
ncbi:MAG: YheT family hydrolase, partial [Longimicrobiales bacterium]